MRTVVADNAFKKCMMVDEPETRERQAAMMKSWTYDPTLKRANRAAQVLQPLGELCRLLGAGHLSATYRSFMHWKTRTMDMLSKNDFCDHRAGQPAEMEGTK